MHFMILTMKSQSPISRTTTSRCHHQHVLSRRDQQLRRLHPAPSSVLHSRPLPRPLSLRLSLKSRKSSARRLLEETNLLMTEIIETEIFPVTLPPSLLLQEHDPTTSATDISHSHSSNINTSSSSNVHLSLPA